MRKTTKIIVVILVVIIIPVSSFFIVFKLNDNPPPYEKILLNRFPISLEILFKNDTPIEKEAKLNGIRNSCEGGWLPFIDPYPNYFHGYHSPATFKWYLYVNRHTPISFPVDSYLVITHNSATTKTINGTEVRVDLGASFLLNYYITIELGHVCINRSLVEAWENAPETRIFGESRKNIFIPADSIIGFTHDLAALDFIIDDRTLFNYNTPLERDVPLHRANPFLYFTTEVQTELMSY
jgi:hypothetical protein